MFVFPIIIVDSSLFECYLDKGGKVVIENLEDIDLFFPWRLGDDIGTCIRILTYDRLAVFISEAKSVVEALSSLLQNDIKKKMKMI